MPSLRTWFRSPAAMEKHGSVAHTNSSTGGVEIARSLGS